MTPAPGRSAPAGRDSAATAAMPPLARYALSLGDDALVLAQRCGEWVACAPELEEDVALANIGLDLLGQARTLLTYAGEVEAVGRDEDALAYRRDERDFLNVQLVELANGDFAVTTARLLVFSIYHHLLYARLATSADPTLAGVAAKAVKEVAYHRDHAGAWVVRLGDGTDESHARMQAGLERVWPYVDELFAPDGLDPALVAAGVAIDPASLRPEWDAAVAAVLDRATLHAPEPGRARRPARHPQRRDGPPAGRDAAPAPLPPGSDVVTPTTVPGTTTAPGTTPPPGTTPEQVHDRLARAREVAGAVLDPEVPVLTIADLGVLRDVRVAADGVLEVVVTPTYSGCPAMDAIRDDVRVAIDDAGLAPVRVVTVLSPAWTTDWMTDAGRQALVTYGIAPPSGRAPVTAASAAGRAVPVTLSVRCPRCASPNTRELSRFGSTACKSLWQCRSCAEPFDHFKAI